MNPKKIETLLLEGTPFGLRYHDLANWTGRIFVSSRASFKDLLDREELSKPGVYFLIGENEETGRLQVYIGEADPGITTAQALWRIKRTVFTGDDSETLFAGGNENFDNVWDNRAGFSYS